MTPIAWIVVAIIVVAVIVIAIGWIGIRRRRLQSRFGPEYQRVAAQSGSKWRADSELVARQQRRQRLDIHPLPVEQRDRYARDWQQVQANFVDQPYESVANADKLVTEVMRERGYPMDNFDQHANDISVDFPRLVDDYRGAHAVATRQKSANTEELRSAMLHYRNLFQEMLGEQRDQSGRIVPDGQPVSSEPSPDGQPVNQRQAEPSPATREGQR